MKKEFTEIFWKLYSINKDAQKLQEVFMPSNDREILKDLIYATSECNAEVKLKTYKSLIKSLIEYLRKQQ